MTLPPLNPWLDSTLKKARRLYEDSDRVTRAAELFVSTICRVHRLATSAAIRCPEPWPTVERFQPDDGSPTLLLEWHDKSSGWFLSLTVKRSAAEKPFVTLELSGQPQQYATEKPSDEDIVKALHDYFEAWKRETKGKP